MNHVEIKDVLLVFLGPEAASLALAQLYCICSAE